MALLNPKEKFLAIPRFVGFRKIFNRGSEIVIRLDRRTYSPVLRQASLPETITVPWWGGRTLRYEYA